MPTTKRLESPIVTLSPHNYFSLCLTILSSLEIGK